MKRMVVSAKQTVDTFDDLWKFTRQVDNAVVDMGFNGYRSESERIARNEAYLDEVRKRAGMLRSLVNKTSDEGLIEFADSLEDRNYHGFLVAFVRFLADEGISIEGHVPWEYDFKPDPVVLEYQNK